MLEEALLRERAADDDRVAPLRGVRSIHPLGSIGAAGSRHRVHVQLQRVARLVGVGERVGDRVRVRVRVTVTVTVRSRLRLPTRYP